MAAYGSLVAWAQAMGHTEAAELLEETLEEEKAADEKLTALAEGGINQEAARAAHDDGGEEGDDEGAKEKLIGCFGMLDYPLQPCLLEMVLGNDAGIAHWIYDLFCSLRPQALQHKVSIEPLGNFDTLSQRLEAELAASKFPAPMVALVGAWSRKPTI